MLGFQWISARRFQASACLVQPKPVSVGLTQIEFRVLQNLMAFGRTSRRQKQAD
jgi:hypothetical protein